MQVHVAKTVSSCFAVLRRIRSICRSVTKPVLQSLDVSIVQTRLDYESARLLPVCLTCCSIDFSPYTRHRATDLLGSEVRSWRNSVTPRPSSVTNSGENSVRLALAVLLFRTALPYLSAELTRVADADYRRRLRSSNTAALVIPRSKHSTSGDRDAFPVAAARVWNSLSPFVSSSPSLPVFKRRLKTEFFTRL